MTQFNIDIIFVRFGGMGQKFGDLGQLRDIAAGIPIAANPIVSMDQMRVNEVATEGILSLGGNFMRRRIRC